MLQIAICDDDTVHLAYIRKLTEVILKVHKPEVTEYSGAYELLFKMDGTGYSTDIALLDIQMPDIDGIEHAKEINRIAPECKIIFITSYIVYAPEVYDTDHIFFVLKSQIKDRLPSALERVMANLQKPKSFLTLKIGASIIRVPTDTVLYIERELHKTRIITVGCNYVTNQSPAELLSVIAEDQKFIRCHQSYWVNWIAISKMEVNSFLLTDGSEVPISRAQKAAARNAFFSLISRNM